MLSTSILSGQTITSAITAAGQTTSYSFYAPAGASIIFTVGDTTAASNFRSYVTLDDPYGNALTSGGSAYASASASGQVSYTVPYYGAGTYTAIVASSNNTVGAYAANLVVAGLGVTQAADSDGDGGAILSGQDRTGSINRYGDLDVYTFTAGSGDGIRVSVGDSNAASDYRPAVTLFAPDGTNVGSGYSAYDGASANGEVDYTVPTTEVGTYTILVQDDGGNHIGSYGLNLALAGPGVTQAADGNGDGGTLVSGADRAATMNHYGDLDIYTFTAVAGAGIKVTAGDANATSDYRPYITLYGPDGALIGNGSTAYDRSTAGAEVDYQVPAYDGGTFTAVVEDDGGTHLGAYEVNLALAPAAQGTDINRDGGGLVSGTDRAGTIEYYGDSDVYTFAANGGDGLRVSVGDATATSDFRPYLTLYSPTGAVLGTASTSYARSTAAAEVDYQVPALGGGTYYAVVQSNGNTNIGAYRIALSRADTNQGTDPAGDGGILTSGVDRAGTIGSYGDLDVYTFTTTPGASIQLAAGDAATTSDFRPEITLYGPTGLLIQNAGTAYANADDAAEIDYRVPALGAGTYTVVVESNGGTNVGPYNLSLAVAPATQGTDANGDGGTLTSGVAKTAAIQKYGDIDVYTFGASAKDALTVTVADPTSASDYRPNLTLYAPDGTKLAASSSPYSVSNSSATVTYTVPPGAAGTYSVVVTSSGEGNLGAYYVLMNGNHPPTASSLVVTAPAAQTSIYSSAASFALGSFKATNAPGPYAVRVYWGDGTPDTVFTATTAAALAAQSHTFAQTGTYTVSIAVTDPGHDVSNVATFPVTVTGPTASITGTVFKDANANGKQDAGESGFAGVTVYLDLGLDVTLDATDPRATTSATGAYTFTGVFPGTYRVREVLPSGYKLVAPTLGYDSVTATTTAVDAPRRSPTPPSPPTPPPW